MQTSRPSSGYGVWHAERVIAAIRHLEAETQELDGRIIEQTFPHPRKAAALKPGQKVLVWYDPADPSDVLVYGRYGRRADGIFIAAGIGLVIAGAVIAEFGS